MSIESRSRSYGKVFDHWQITDFLGSGSGGKSAVFKLIHTDPNSSVQSALKVISLIEQRGSFENLSDRRKGDYLLVKKECKEHAAQEVQLMDRLQGRTNIVAYLDHTFVDWSDENGFGCDMLIRMELLQDLRSKIELDHVFSQNEVIKIGREICSALILCHKKNILHRDIKPENIFFNADGNYKLGDFGVSRIISAAPMSKASTGVYTPEYAAPEQLSGNYDIRVDIYSLGLVLYELTNGNLLPFTKSAFLSEKAIQKRISGKPLPDPSNAGKELTAVIKKACAFRPEDRYQSAEAFMDALNAVPCDNSKPVIAGHLSDDSDKKAVLVGGSNATQYARGNVETIDLSQDHKDRGRNGTQTAVADQKEKIVADKKGRGSVNATQDAGQKIASGNERQTIKAEPPEPRRISFIKVGLLVTVIFLILLCVKFCVGNSPEQTEPAESAVATTEEPNPTETNPEETLPFQADWTDWVEKEDIPSYVTEEYYDIEEQTLYSTSKLEKTTSTETDTLEGWEHVDTISNLGEYGPWSDWSSTEIFAAEGREVETQTRYRFRTKETTTSTSDSKSGWSLDKDKTSYSWGEYGPWSSWSIATAFSSDSRQVQEKTQYSYRDKWITQEHSAWGDWSSWSDNRQDIGNGDLKKEDSRTVWPYYYFLCSNCGAHMHGYGTCYTWAGGCGAATYESGWREIWSTTSWSNAGLRDWYSTGKYYTHINGELCFQLSNAGSKTQYRYATRTLKDVTNYGEWSEWSDTVYTASSTRDIQTRKVFRYRDRQQIPTYHFYRWGEWSEWSTKEVSGNSNRQVEQKKYYRYREKVMQTTYCFQRWSEPTEFLPIPAEANDELCVEEKVVYRYKSKDLRNPYTDVSKSDLYYESVMWVTEEGIMNGTSDTTFDPNGNVSRGQMVTMLWRAIGEPEPEATESTFMDVDNDSPYLKPVMWAIEEGITSGETSESFGVDSVCNRAQVITFLYRAAGSPKVSLSQEPFADVESDAFYYDAVLWAYENAISNGVSTTEFGIQNSCNRAQVAVMLHRTFDGSAE